jgi:hypothetical protein
VGPGGQPHSASLLLVLARSAKDGEVRRREERCLIFACDIDMARLRMRECERSCAHEHVAPEHEQAPARLPSPSTSQDDIENVGWFVSSGWCRRAWLYVRPCVKVITRQWSVSTRTVSVLDYLSCHPSAELVEGTTSHRRCAWSSVSCTLFPSPRSCHTMSRKRDKLKRLFGLKAGSSSQSLRTAQTPVPGISLSKEVASTSASQEHFKIEPEARSFYSEADLSKGASPPPAVETDPNVRTPCWIKSHKHV